LANPNIREPVLKYIAHAALCHPAASIYISSGQNRNVTVATVAATVDHAFLYILWNLKGSGLIFIQGPKMILLVEISLAASGFIVLELLIADGKQLSVFLGCHGGIQISAAGNVAGKRKDIHTGPHYLVNNARNLHTVRLGHRGHDHAADPRSIDASDLLQGTVEGARLAEPVMGLPQAVQGQLILLAAILLEPLAHLVIQMKWVSENGEGDLMGFQKRKELPEIRMQNGVSTGNIKIRKPVVYLAKVQAVVERVLHLLPRHGIQLLAGIPRENIAVLAPLVAFVGNMPLKRKILFHRV
jgi:hypothetical protein